MDRFFIIKWKAKGEGELTYYITGQFLDTTRMQSDSLLLICHAFSNISYFDCEYLYAQFLDQDKCNNLQT